MDLASILDLVYYRKQKQLQKDYKVYLNHILDSIKLIEDYTKGMSFKEFKHDTKTQDYYPQ